MLDSDFQMVQAKIVYFIPRQRLRLAAVEMEPWAKKGMRLISAISASKTDIDYSLIREIETTTASLHDAPA